MNTAEDYPIVSSVLSERIAHGRSERMETWLREADAGLARIDRDASERAVRDGLTVRRALGLAVGLIDKLAVAATMAERPR